MSSGYLTTRDIQHRLNGCSTSTLWRYQQENQTIFDKSMPKPVKRGAGSQSLWDETMFNEWEQSFFRNSKT